MPDPAHIVRARSPYLEDFEVGDVHVSYARTVTEAHLVGFTAFAGLNLPIFIDHDFARREGEYGSPIAPGFLTAAVSAGMLESILGAHVLAGLGMDAFVFPRPVMPGDTLHAEVSIQGKRPTRKPGCGVLKVGVNVLNQRGEVVLSYHAQVLMKQSEPQSQQGNLQP